MYMSISQGNKSDKNGNLLPRDINRIGSLLVVVRYLAN